MGLRGKGAKAKSLRPPKMWRSTKRAKPVKPVGTRAEKVVAFIESLKITSGPFAGQFFKLRPWQRTIIKKIYAVKDGKRVVRRVLLTMPRKNGKSELVAALALTHLAGPEAESRGLVVSAAADRDQAAIIFNNLVAYIEADAKLSRQCNIVRFSKKIEHLPTRSEYFAMSSDARKAHGLGPSFWVYDELSQAPNRNLYDNLSTGGGGRKEPLGVVISTQSADPNHVMTELVREGTEVLEGRHQDATFLPIIYSAPMDADIFDEKVWRACNPALGDFRSLDEMRAMADRAKRVPAAEATFRNLYLNQPVDPVVQLFAPADWDACSEFVDDEQLRGAECYGGLDLSLRRDLTAFVLHFPESGAVRPYFWLPAEDLREKAVKDRAPYEQWTRDGYLETTPGRTIDMRAVARRIAEIVAEFEPRAIAFDRWGIESFKRVLGEEGIEDLPLVPFGQGFRDMSPAVDALEAAIVNHKLRHGGHPVLEWCTSNAAAELDAAGGRKLSKAKSRGRIDGLVALAMAIGAQGHAPAPPQTSMYSTVALGVA